MKGVLLAISVIFTFSGCCEYKVIQRFSLANGVSVEILRETEWEHSPILFYTVRESGSVRVPRTFFDTAGDEELQMIDSDKGVVGFVLTSAPSDVVILFDQTTGESWPQTLGEESTEAALSRGERMLLVLQAAFPRREFVLKN